MFCFLWNFSLFLVSIIISKYWITASFCNEQEWWELRLLEARFSGESLWESARLCSGWSQGAFQDWGSTLPHLTKPHTPWNTPFFQKQYSVYAGVSLREEVFLKCLSAAPRTCLHSPLMGWISISCFQWDAGFRSVVLTEDTPLPGSHSVAVCNLFETCLSLM